MAIAQGSQSATSAMKEVTYGVNPITADGDTTVIPRVSDGTNLTKGQFDDPTINPNRQTTYYRQGNIEVAGDLTVAYSHENFDNLLESLFYGTWTADVLKIGSTISSYTHQIQHSDVNIYRVFSGVIPSTLSMEVNLDGVVETTFGLIGSSMIIDDRTGSPLPTNVDTTPLAAGDKQPVIHLDGVFQEGAVNQCMTSVSLEIDNGIISNYCLGNDTVKELTSTNVAITGTMSVYFEDAVLLNKFLSGASSSISFTLDDGQGNSHTWLLPNIKYTGSEVTIEDGGNVPQTLDFVALYDTTEGTAVKITRTP